jgi:hypothetical protein
VTSLLKELFRECGGNAVRIQEKIGEEHSVSIPYSTLTRIVREMGLRVKAPRRVGTYVFEPGEEMQHDTSPHRLMIGERKITAQCAVVVLGYSRRAYMQYYQCFTRLEAKTFLTEAFRYLDGACRRCTIDNTSVIVAGGSGPAAVIAPEMERFGEIFGFTFQPHVIGHADRKAHVERFFWYVEKNFLAGRRFQDWRDLNLQAAGWCREIADKRFMRALGMSPLEAYIKEKPHLLRLPPYIPPVYRTIHRRVDVYGFVHLETNRYSVPEKHVGAKVEIHQYWDRIEVFAKQRLVAKHAREIGRRNRRITNPAHHKALPVRTGPPVKSAAEGALSGRAESLDNYVALLKKRPGRGEMKLRRLLALQRTYPAAAFLAAVEQAYFYGLMDMNRLEKLILANILDDFFSIE